jgi:hypothetical protein
MRKIENDCCGCDLPCVNCGRKHVEHIYCDHCKQDIGDEGYVVYENEELCYYCFVELLVAIFLKTKDEKRNFLLKFYEQSNDPDLETDITDMTEEEMVDEILTLDFDLVMETFAKLGIKIDYTIY